MAETEHPWRDKETLERLHFDEGLNQEEMGDRLGCTRRTIAEWFSRHGIEGRKGAPRREYAYYETHVLGYERWQNLTTPDRGKVCKVHRLAAVAWFGYGAVVDNHVHHKNGIPWDNREENFELLSPSDHMKTHHEVWDMRGANNYNAKLDWDDVRRIREMRGLVSAEELSDEFGVRASHIKKIWRFEAWDSSDNGAFGEGQNDG